MSCVRRAVLCLAGLTVTAASDAMAQAPRRPVSVQVGVGGTVPIGDFAQDTKTGFHGMAALQYEPDRNIWGVRGEVALHRSGYTDDFLGDVGASPDDDLSNDVLHVGAAAVLLGARREQGLTPYLLGGAGLYRLTASAKQGTAVLSESANGFGFSVGAGLRLGRSTGMTLEVRWHQFSVTPDGEGATKTTYQMIPVTLGVRF
jgi:opacity protein-like surface antigen